MQQSVIMVSTSLVRNMSKFHAAIAVMVLAAGALCMRLLHLGVGRRLLSTMATEYTSGTYSMAFVTVPNEEVAKKLAHGLVKEKLVACVNIIPKVTSVYEWKGAIEEDSELLLMMKTRTSTIPEVSKFVRENHPYDVAEVISSLIDQGNAPYLDWIGQIVPKKS